MTTVRLRVPTIKCEGCVERIRSTLVTRAGVHRVEGDPERKELSVTFNPEQLSDQDIRAAVWNAGFMVG